MKKQKKSLVTKSRLSKALNVKPDEPNGTVYYVRVKPKNKDFMEAQAEKCGMSLSRYTDKVFDNLRGE